MRFITGFLPFSSPRLGPESRGKKLRPPRCKRGMTRTRSWSNWWPSTATSLQRISASEMWRQNIREHYPRKQHWMVHTSAIYIYIYIYIHTYKKTCIYMYIYISIYIYSEGTCPRRLLYHLFEAPVLGPWAHLGFEKKRPQTLNKRPTKAWRTNRNGLDVKLLTISRKTSKAPVANHNGLDAKLLRSSWKTTKAWVANHNGLDAKLLRSSWKTTKAWVANHNGLDAKLLRMSLKIED